MHCDWISHHSSPAEPAIWTQPNQTSVIFGKWLHYSKANLNYHFQPVIFDLCQSPYCHVSFLGTDSFLNTHYSFSSVSSWRHQMKLAGSKLKASKMKSFRAFFCKRWQIWEVHMDSRGHCAISRQTNALKINKCSKNNWSRKSYASNGRRMGENWVQVLFYTLSWPSAVAAIRKRMWGNREIWPDAVWPF